MNVPSRYILAIRISRGSRQRKLSIEKAQWASIYPRFAFIPASTNAACICEFGYDEASNLPIQIEKFCQRGRGCEMDSMATNLVPT